MRDWVSWKKYGEYKLADEHRKRLIEGNRDLEQGKNIQIKHKGDGMFHLRIAKNAVSDETAKALGL